MTARKLRVATPSDAPEKLTVAQAAASGDHRKLLVAMRERIAVTVANPDCPPRDLASLTRRLQDIAKEIEDLDRRVKEEGRDASTVPDEAWSAEAL